MDSFHEVRVIRNISFRSERKSKFLDMICECARNIKHYSRDRSRSCNSSSCSNLDNSLTTTNGMKDIEPSHKESQGIEAALFECRKRSLSESICHGFLNDLSTVPIKKSPSTRNLASMLVEGGLPPVNHFTSDSTRVINGHFFVGEEANGSCSSNNGGCTNNSSNNTSSSNISCGSSSGSSGAKRRRRVSDAVTIDSLAQLATQMSIQEREESDTLETSA